MEYLVFIERSIWFTICVAIYIWGKKGASKIDKPKELDNGDFAIPKPEDEYMDGVEYDEIKENPKFKEVQNYEAIPNPSGPPPKGPIR